MEMALYVAVFAQNGWTVDPVTGTFTSRTVVPDGDVPNGLDEGVYVLV
jgi:hypothetical protein